jgi:hypothetical protein
MPVISTMTPVVAPRVLLDPPSFPRDTPGRLLLLTVIGLAADLLAPWSNVYGQHEAIAHIGAPALGLVALFALAGLPLVRGSFRHEPLIAVLPLLVGAFCAGIGMMYWLQLYRENQQVTAIPTNFASDVIGSQAQVGDVVIAPDVGLYLFLIGSGVLVVAGYQIFLAASSSRAARLAEMAASAAGTAPAGTAAGVNVLARPAQIGVVATGPAGPAGPAGQGAQVASRPILAAAEGPAGATGLNGYAPAAPGAGTPGAGGLAEHASNASNGTGDARVALPGSTAWNEAPQQPSIMRPAAFGAWKRAPGVRR